MNWTRTLQLTAAPTPEQSKQRHLQKLKLHQPKKSQHPPTLMFLKHFHVKTPKHSVIVLLMDGVISQMNSPLLLRTPRNLSGPHFDDHWPILFDSKHRAETAHQTKEETILLIMSMLLPLKIWPKPRLQLWWINTIFSKCVCHVYKQRHPWSTQTASGNRTTNPFSLAGSWHKPETLGWMLAIICKLVNWNCMKRRRIKIWP